MADKKYLDLTGLSTVADKVNSRLKTVITLPVSADVGAVRLYVGTTDANYTKGHIYQYQTNQWVDITDVVTSLAASAITYDNTSSGLTATDAQDAIDELNNAIEQIPAGIVPKGTVAFASLPTLASATIGDMYNISDDFTTTSDFIVPDVDEKAGSNVYCANVGTDASPVKKWDVFAVPGGGSPIVVDQTYDPTSSNAQSGTAVKQAIDEAITVVLNTGF